MSESHMTEPIHPYLAKPIMEWLNERVDNSLAGMKFKEAITKIDRLRFAIYQYGGHIPPCPGRPCECGFLAEWQFAELPATILDAAKIALLKPAPSDSIDATPK